MVISITNITITQTKILFAYSSLKYSTILPVSQVAHPNDTGINFLVNQNPNVTDLSISSTIASRPRPGFKHSLVLTLKNEGTNSLPFSVKAIRDPYTVFKNSTPSPTLIWPN